MKEISLVNQRLSKGEANNRYLSNEKNTEKTNEKNFLEELKVLRLFALALVVLGHSTVIYTGAGMFKATIASQIYSVITTYVYSFHVPMFIFISGAIYYYCKNTKGQYKAINELISNKFKRLMIPLFLIAAFYMIPIKMVLGIQGDGSYINHVKNMFLGRNIGHLWFLFMLFDIFIIFYIYEKYIMTLKNSAIINIIVFFTLNNISGMLPSMFLINRAAQYIIYFYLGYLMYSKKDKLYEKINSKSNLSIISIIGLLIISMLMMIIAKKVLPEDIVGCGIITEVLTICTALFGIIECYLIVHLLLSKTNNSLINKITDYFNNKSYSIYLLHEPLIFIVLYFISSSNINPTILVLACFIASITVALLLNYVYKYFISIIKGIFQIKVRRYNGT